MEVLFFNLSLELTLAMKILYLTRPNPARTTPCGSYCLACSNSDNRLHLAQLAFRLLVCFVLAGFMRER